MRITFKPHYEDWPTWYHPCVDGKILDIDIIFNECGPAFPYHCNFNMRDKSDRVIVMLTIPAVKGREKEALEAVKPIIRHTLKGLGY